MTGEGDMRRLLIGMASLGAATLMALMTWLLTGQAELQISVARLEVKIETISDQMSRMTASNPHQSYAGAEGRANR